MFFWLVFILGFWFHFTWGNLMRNWFFLYSIHFKKSSHPREHKTFFVIGKLRKLLIIGNYLILYNKYSSNQIICKFVVTIHITVFALQSTFNMISILEAYVLTCVSQHSKQQKCAFALDWPVLVVSHACMQMWKLIHPARVTWHVKQTRARHPMLN